MSIYRKLIVLAVPATLSVAIDPLAATIDTMLIGQKNADWLAPFSAGNAILSSVVFSLNFLVYTVSARVAQAYGKRDAALLHKETLTALAVAVGLGVIATLLLVVLKTPLLTKVMELSGPALSQAEDYYLLRVAGLPLALLASAMVGALRGIQELTATVVIIGAATVVNAAVSALCLFGLGTGVWGAALGTSLSFAVSVVIGWLVLKRSNPALRLSDLVPPGLVPTRRGLAGTKVGSVSGYWQDVWQGFGQDAKFQLIRSLLLNATFFSATVLCARAGNLALGGHQLIYQLMLVVGCFLDGLAVSAVTVGGEAIGQNDYEAWWRMALRSMVLVVGLSLLLTAVLHVGHHQVLTAFTADTAMHQAVHRAFHIYIYSIPLLGLAYQLDGLLFSAKMFRQAAIGLGIAAGLFYLPTIAIGYGPLGDYLALAWLAIGMLGLGRFAAGAYFLRQAAKGDFALVRANQL